MAKLDIASDWWSDILGSSPGFGMMVSDGCAVLAAAALTTALYCKDHRLKHNGQSGTIKAFISRKLKPHAA